MESCRRSAEALRWRGKSGSFSDGFVLDRSPHEIKEQDEAAKRKKRFKDTANQRIELQKAAQSPASRPRRPDHLGADKNAHGDEGGYMQQIDFLAFRHVNPGLEDDPAPLYHGARPGKPTAFPRI
jgi:hypothetical protein